MWVSCTNKGTVNISAVIPLSASLPTIVLPQKSGDCDFQDFAVIAECPSPVSTKKRLVMTRVRFPKPLMSNHVVHNGW